MSNQSTNCTLLKSPYIYFSNSFFLKTLRLHVKVCPYSIHKKYWSRQNYWNTCKLFFIWFRIRKNMLEPFFSFSATIQFCWEICWFDLLFGLISDMCFTACWIFWCFTSQNIVSRLNSKKTIYFLRILFFFVSNIWDVWIE